MPKNWFEGKDGYLKKMNEYMKQFPKYTTLLDFLAYFLFSNVIKEKEKETKEVNKWSFIFL